MSKVFALALLTVTLSLSAYAEGGPAPASPASASTITTSGEVVAQAHKNSLERLYVPSRDCCYDEVNLDRPMPSLQPNRGPSCCWDPSNWD